METAALNDVGWAAWVVAFADLADDDGMIGCASCYQFEYKRERGTSEKARVEDNLYLNFTCLLY